MNRTLHLLFLCALMSVSPVQAGEAIGSTEPNLQTALAWWPEQRNVYTPIGWKDHYFRFTVLYNGTVFFEPCSDWTSRTHAQKFKGQDFQLTFAPTGNGQPAPLPKTPVQLWKLDGGHGLQGWRAHSETPVLWTDYPLQEGLVIRQEIFAHVKGGAEVETALEPIYAWIRLSVTHVDEARAPKTFSLPVQLSRNYHEHAQRYLHEDGITVDVNPNRARYSKVLKAGGAGTDGNAGLRIVEPDGKIRLAVLPTASAKIAFSEIEQGIYALKVDLDVKVGASVDLIFPALPQPAAEIENEQALGFDGALAECEKFWSKKPATAARFQVPEEHINQAIAQSIKFAEIIAEKDYVNGDYAQLSGCWGYDQLWSTPTSMNNHMFLSLLGYHDAVAKYSEIFRRQQGAVKPPGPSYELHPGYFSTPKTLTSFDWLSDHGAILLQVSTAALMSGDPGFIAKWTGPIVKACDFIKDSCARTDHDGVKGSLPPAVATDEVIPTQAVWNMAWNYRGLTAAVRFLQRIGHPRAEEFATFAAQFKRTFDREFRDLAKTSPTWTDALGNQRVKPPATLSRAPMPWHPFSDAFYLDTGPMVLVWGGLMNAGDELMRSSVEFFRDGPNRKLQGARCHPLCRPVLTREISSCEPCYSWNVFHSWRLGDRAHFLEGLYSLFAGSLSRQTFIACEHRHGMQGNLFSTGMAFNLARLAMIDDAIQPGELHLLRLVPLAWISSEKETVLENMPTEFGPVDLRFKKSPDGKTLNLTFEGHWREKPKKIVLHLPAASGLEAIRLNGQSQSAKDEIVM